MMNQQKQSNKNEFKLPVSSPGSTLKDERLLKRISLSKASSSLKISKKQIQQIESWDLENLPKGIYLEGIIKRYAKFLSIDPVPLLERINESDHEKKLSGNLNKTNVFKSKRYFVLSKATIITILLIVVLSAFGYIAWQGAVFTAKPRLVVHSPKNGEKVNSEIVSVSGNVSQSTQVYINGVPVLVEPNGAFSDEVVLQRGSNNIEISAINNISRESKIQRVVIFEP